MIGKNVLRLFRNIETLRRRRAGEHVRSQLRGQTEPAYTRDYVSSVSEAWLRVLEPFAGRPEIRILEIGSLEGRSAVWFLQHVLTDPSSTLVCVDLFSVPATEARFDHNVGCVDRGGQVRKVRGRSDSVLPGLERASFHAIYVDGGHEAATVLLDAVLAWRLLKEGGVLIFDDYLWRSGEPAWLRPQMGVDLFREAFADEMETLLEDYQVIVRKRSGRTGSRLAETSRFEAMPAPLELI